MRNVLKKKHEEREGERKREKGRKSIGEMSKYTSHMIFVYA